MFGRKSAISFLDKNQPFHFRTKFSHYIFGQKSAIFQRCATLGLRRARVRRKFFCIIIFSDLNCINLDWNIILFLWKYNNSNVPTLRIQINLRHTFTNFRIFFQPCPLISQCAPGFSNPNQKVHGLFHFHIADMYKTDQNHLKKPSVIWLPKQ